MDGYVKTANSRGFGFIATESGIDFYFYHSEWKDSEKLSYKQLLTKVVNKEQVKVSFDNDSTTTDGPRAVNVRLASTKEVNEG